MLTLGRRACTPICAPAAGRPLPGAVRASLGHGSTAEDVDRLVAALREIAAHGPRYVPEHDEHLPVEAGRFAA